MIWSLMLMCIPGPISMAGQTAPFGFFPIAGDAQGVTFAVGFVEDSPPYLVFIAKF